MKLQSDLREFIALLNSHGVEYLLIGGHAVAFHGHPRFTGDIDFWVRPTEANGELIMAVLRAFGFSNLALSAADFTRSESVIQLGRVPNRIDLLTSISGVEFDEAWADRVVSEIDGLPTAFLGRASLIKNKLASGRDRDVVDAKRLEAIAAAQRRTPK